MRILHSRRARIVTAAVAAAVAVPALGLTAAYATAGAVPRGTTVLGIDIGGGSRQRAEAALRAGLDARAAELAAPVAIRVGEADAEITPADVGLAVDVPATVAAAARQRSLVTAVTGGAAVPPVVEVDPVRLHEALAEVATEVGEAMTLPEIRFEETTPVPTYPEPGRGLDPGLSAAAVADGWLRAEPISVPLVDIEPVTTAADVDRLVADLAEPAVAAPVAVTTPEGELTVAPEAIAAALRLTADERGEIVPEVHARDLRRALAEQLADLETEPKDARITLANGEPRILASSGGERVDVTGLAAALLEVLPRPAPRELSAEMVTVAPEVSSDEMADLGVKERVSTFTTYFDGGLSSPRTQNIVRAAEQVDGALVLPGETFSLNGFTGPRGYAEGYVDAPVIIGGKLVPGVGGGLSQFTTTLFNAAYYAGLEDVEHTPHSYWFSRYPSVIESTIFYPTLDMKFRNDTGYGVLIDTSYTADSITVSMWSTKIWDEVRTEWSAKRDITSPRTQYLEPGPSCIATEGIEGFTQDAWRIFVRDGEEVRRETFTWRYDAEPRFICGEEPDG
jgi:vancomycin resistance protein YoaR